MNSVERFKKASLNKATSTEKSALKRLLRLAAMTREDKPSKDEACDEEIEDEEEEDDAEEGDESARLEKGLSVCAPIDEFGCPLLPDEAMYLHVP
jgi:hypothetical protein